MHDYKNDRDHNATGGICQYDAHIFSNATDDRSAGYLRGARVIDKLIAWYL
jgi:hypothetical protein